MTSEERERRIDELVRYCGLTRAEAEFAVAIELGEIDGDVIGVAESSDPTGDSQES